MKRWIPPILAVGIITVMSSTVITTNAFTKAIATRGPIHVSESAFRSFWESWWWVFVKGFHALEFGILACIFHHVFKGKWQRALAATVMMASLDEWHQTFVPARGGRITDVLIDVGGAIVGLIIATAVSRRKRKQAEDRISSTD